MEAGQMDWSFDRVDMGATIREALAALEGLIKENDVEVGVTLPDALPEVLADHDQLIQVMINLVSNAIKFCDKTTGKIAVSVTTEEDVLVVTVSDNGYGIPDDRTQDIFEKFHQSVSSGEDKPQGSGLGLAICREIVTFMGGEIWVTNQPNSGAQFAFTIPRADRQKEQLSAQ
jgi:signal transduction histidine kinase